VGKTAKSERSYRYFLSRLIAAWSARRRIRIPRNLSNIIIGKRRRKFLAICTVRFTDGNQRVTCQEDSSRNSDRLRVNLFEEILLFAEFDLSFAYSWQKLVQ